MLTRFSNKEKKLLPTIHITKHPSQAFFSKVEVRNYDYFVFFSKTGRNYEECIAKCYFKKAKRKDRRD